MTPLGYIEPGDTIECRGVLYVALFRHKQEFAPRDRWAAMELETGRLRTNVFMDEATVKEQGCRLIGDSR